MKNVTTVKVREPEGRVCYIPITSETKPKVRLDIAQNWERVLNMVAKLLNVPSTLIMNIHNGEIEVFLKDTGTENPYETGERAPLLGGLYCETVLGNRSQLYVPNSLESDVWNDNPDVELNMISYLGFPISWPDSELFGTICVLDSKTIEFSHEQVQLLETVQSIIQKDLELLDGYRELEEKLSKQDLLLRDMVHRTKNSFNSILNFCQIYQMDEVDEANALKKIESKLWNCITLYQELCYNSDGRNLEMISFLEQLVSLILDSHTQEEITYEISGDDCILLPEKASLIGSVITELTLNTIKYAYEGLSQPNRAIEISCECTLGFVTITYKDNGVGIPDEVQSFEKNSIGWSILVKLIESWKGHVDIVAGPEGHVTFCFPI